MKNKSALKILIASGILAVIVFAAVSFADSAQNSPTSCTTGWTSCSNAFGDNANFASATQASKVSDWYNYGFSIPSGSTINSVTVRTDFWATKTNGYIDVQVSNNGGTTWGSTHRVGGNTAEQTFNIDVTSDFSWTPSMFSNANFRTRATTVKVGGGGNPTWKLDWIPVTVVYTPPDTTAPTVSSVTPTSANEDVATDYQVTASDNVGVTACTFYWNNASQGAMTLVSGSAQNGVWQKTYTENTPGIRTARAECQDAASNNGVGATTSITINDITPPGPVTNLSETATGTTWIRWTWTNPSDSDLNHIEIWLNNTFKANTTNAFYNATGLQSNTGYELEVRPVDNSGNIGQWTTDIAFTQQQDTEAPTVSSVTPTTAVVNVPTNYTVTASDNVGVTNCNFYWDSINKGSMTLVSGNAQSGTWQRTYTEVNTTGVHTAQGRCVDAASNQGNGLLTNVTVTAN